MSQNEFWKRYKNSELKFRIWSHELKQFISSEDSVNLEFRDSFWMFDESREVQQYIGCQDIDGIDIFEGDILETDEAGWIAVVVFGDGRFLLESRDGGFSSDPNWKECRIIGNVYENPELVN